MMVGLDVAFFLSFDFYLVVEKLGVMATRTLFYNPPGLDTQGPAVSEPPTGWGLGLSLSFLS